MVRILSFLALAGMLSACAIPSANQQAMNQEKLACARVGIAPGSGYFSQCVGDLDMSQRNMQNLAMQ